MKKNIAIITPCLSEGDAVSNDVIEMQKLLAKKGYNCRIYTETHTHSSQKIFPIKNINKYIKDKSDIIIYHFSMGWSYIQEILKIDCVKVIKYHNITPVNFYTGINQDYVNACRVGRNQLAEIASANCHLYLADSFFNALELKQFGVEPDRCLIVPPFNHIDRLFELEANLSIIDRYQDNKTNVLMVGRLAPNKGYLDLFDAFHTYLSYYNSQSRLILVGGEDKRLKTYNQMLRKKAKFLEILPYIVFAGKVTDNILKAYYLIADFFVTTSEHEGFCVPLIEAMAMKIPVIAYNSTAIPYTVGKAGLVWNERDPHLIAGSLDYLNKNLEICMSLGKIGFDRYEKKFTNSKIEVQFLSALEKIL